MTDREALYRAVLAMPADDAPRLVLADWLDENGEPDLAAFVRVQCELARLPAEPTPFDCRAVLRPRRRADEQIYRAIVPVADGNPPQVGQIVRLLPMDGGGQKVPDLVVKEVSGRPWPAAWPLPVTEVEVTGMPVDLGETAGRRAVLVVQERNLFVRLGVPPVRVDGLQYEVGVPADDQPVTVRRGFVEEMEVPAAGFLHEANDLLAEYPIRVLRLETMPDVERAEGAEPGTVDASLFGRDFWLAVPADLSDHELILKLFDAEWPGIDVQLPPDGGLGADAED